VKITVDVNELERAIYRFEVNSATCKVRLSHYAKETRESKRKQKWTHTPLWDGEVRYTRGVPNNPEEGRKEIYLDSYVEEMAKQGAAIITGVRPEEVG
jgi:hypothetical protein